MIATVFIGIIVAVCLVSSLIFYIFIRSRDNLKSPSSSSSSTSIGERRQIKYSLRPSFTIIKQKLQDKDLIPRRSSSSITNDSNCKDQSKFIQSPTRSTSISTNLFQPRRPRSANWRQGSIVDPNQMALIQFSLPINNKYRRRSVAICNDIIVPTENTLLTTYSLSPCLLLFSITYLKTSQVKIQFHGLQSLPANISLQQLTIKVKLTPDGKEKSIQIKKVIQNSITFDDKNNEIFILFSNISYEKLHERILSMTIHGKDQSKKTIQLGHIGKIYFNQIEKFDNENRVDFIHEIEKTKPSSVELYISLKKNDDQHIHVDVQRIKGLKIDQKKLDAKYYVQIILLDHHRPLTTFQTKSYRLNSTNFDINEKFNLNILTYNSNNFDRLMIIFNLYSNSNHTNEYKRIGNIKLSSPLFCSGSGTVHWQQFKLRESFSMWHTLNKEHH